MNLRTLLELGRTSNLPTVWTNVLCGSALGLASSENDGPAMGTAIVVGSALFGASSLYVGGMFLNDAFDARWDAEHRPERPIPDGRARLQTVYVMGFGLLAVGILSVSLGSFASGGGWNATLAAVGTAALIVAYDLWHKGLSWAVLLMGSCRAGVYLMAAYTVTTTPSWLVWSASGALAAYVVALTHVARFETGSGLAKAWVGSLLFAPTALGAVLLLRDPSPATLSLGLPLLIVQGAWSLRALSIARSGRPGAIPKSVLACIAGISLVDGALMASIGAVWLVPLALAAFALTLSWHRKVAGT